MVELGIQKIFKVQGMYGRILQNLGGLRSKRKIYGLFDREFSKPSTNQKQTIMLFHLSMGSDRHKNRQMEFFS